MVKTGLHLKMYLHIYLIWVADGRMHSAPSGDPFLSSRTLEHVKGKDLWSDSIKPFALDSKLTIYLCK